MEIYTTQDMKDFSQYYHALAHQKAAFNYNLLFVEQYKRVFARHLDLLRKYYEVKSHAK